MLFPLFFRSPPVRFLFSPISSFVFIPWLACSFIYYLPHSMFRLLMISPLRSLVFSFVYCFSCLFFRVIISLTASYYTFGPCLILMFVCSLRLPPITPQRVAPLAPLQEKGLDAGLAPEAGRSAWNDAGTWEEVEKTEWCKGKITEALRCAPRVNSGCGCHVFFTTRRLSRAGFL